jgi:NTP pyrophosphatase (non-canonical NTP hydrolase)
MDKPVGERIVQWNWERNGLQFDPSLEIKLLSEEAHEFYEALASGDSAHILAEWADFYFVAYGTYAKYHAQPIDSIVMFEVGAEKWKKLDTWMTEVGEQMDHILDEHFADHPGSVRTMKQVALETVTECNELKGTTKNADGKVVKGKNHKNPVELIRERLSLS